MEKKTKPKFEAGYIVQLISGGPKMTIDSVGKDIHKNFNGNYQCKWFAGNKLEHAQFKETSLNLWCEPNKSK